MAKILLVEDERSIRQALRFELEDEGYEVFDVTDFPEAVSAFHAMDCDVVISDLFLGQGNGIQFFNIVNQNDRKVPFIGMTAFPDTRLAEKAKTVLKDRLFIKPFFTSQMKEKVLELLNEKSASYAV